MGISLFLSLCLSLLGLIFPNFDSLYSFWRWVFTQINSKLYQSSPYFIFDQAFLNLNFWYDLIGISRDSMHKRRATGGKKKAWRKKRK